VPVQVHAAPGAWRPALTQEACRCDNETSLCVSSVEIDPVDSYTAGFESHGLARSSTCPADSESVEIDTGTGLAGFGSALLTWTLQRDN
jgi:hypothetical protein